MSIAQPLDALSHERPLDTTVAIEAPEQIRFHYRVAGPAQRAVAQLIDLLIMLAVFATTVLLIGLVAAPFEEWVDYGEAIGRAAQGLLLLTAFALQWGYFVVFEAFRSGQSPGKRALGLRVVKSGGEPVGVIDAMLRNLLRAADLLPFAYMAGVVTMLIDDRFRRLGDLAADTMVVIEDRLTVATPIRIEPPTDEEERGLPSRVVLDADEQRAIELFLRRAPRIAPSLARELATGIVPLLSARHGVRHADPVRLLSLLYFRANETPTTRAKVPNPAAARRPQ